MISYELKAKWVKALRSGKYRQGRGRMKDCMAAAVIGGEPFYCCLGVLAELAGAQLHSQQGYAWLDHVGLQGLIGPAVDGSLQIKLAEMNDGRPGNRQSRKLFAEIADWIEVHVPCEFRPKELMKELIAKVTTVPAVAIRSPQPAVPRPRNLLQQRTSREAIRFQDCAAAL